MRWGRPLGLLWCCSQRSRSPASVGIVLRPQPKDSAGRVLADADRRAELPRRHSFRLRHRHDRRLCAILHRGAMELGKQAHTPAAATRQSLFRDCERASRFRELYQRELSPRRQSLVSQHCRAHVIVSAVRTSKACTPSKAYTPAPGSKVADVYLYSMQRSGNSYKVRLALASSVCPTIGRGGHLKGESRTPSSSRRIRRSGSAPRSDARPLYRESNAISGISPATQAAAA